MHGEDGATHREFKAIARVLVRWADSGLPWAEFLQQVSCAVLEFTGADGLELWFEDRDRVYYWRSTSAQHLGRRQLTLEAELATEQQTQPPARSPQKGALLGVILAGTNDGGRLRSSAARTSAGSLWLDDVALVPFDIDAESQGVLRLESTRSKHFTVNRVESHEGLAQMVGLAIANRKTHTALMERVKELTCMYRIAQLAAESNASLSSTLQSIVELLPPAWQYPSITTARITLDDRTYCSQGFEGGLII